MGTKGITLRIAKIAADLRHLWRRQDIRLSFEERVCNTMNNNVLFDSETWPFRVEDVQKMFAFDD